MIGQIDYSKQGTFEAIMGPTYRQALVAKNPTEDKKKIKKKEVGKSHLNVWKIIFTLSILCLFLSASLQASEKPNWFYHNMQVVFVGVQVADVVYTYRALESGAGEEGNPIARFYINNKATTIAIKAAGSYLILSMLRKIHKRSRTVATISLIVLNVAFGYVAYQNSRI